MDVSLNSQMYGAPVLVPRALLVVTFALLPLVVWAALSRFKTRFATIASVTAAFAAAVGFFFATTHLLSHHIDWRWTRDAASLMDFRISRLGDLTVLIVWYGTSLLLIRHGRRQRRQV